MGNFTIAMYQEGYGDLYGKGTVEFVGGKLANTPSKTIERYDYNFRLSIFSFISILKTKHKF